MTLHYPQTYQTAALSAALLALMGALGVHLLPISRGLDIALVTVQSLLVGLGLLVYFRFTFEVIPGVHEFTVRSLHGLFQATYTRDDVLYVFFHTSPALSRMTVCLAGQRQLQLYSFARNYGALVTYFTGDPGG